MTNKEAIEKMLEDVQRLYNQAGAMRDDALDQEKDFWNEQRRLTDLVYTNLRRLKGFMSSKRGSEDANVKDW